MTTRVIPIALIRVTAVVTSLSSFPTALILLITSSHPFPEFTLLGWTEGLRNLNPDLISLLCCSTCGQLAACSDVLHYFLFTVVCSSLHREPRHCKPRCSSLRLSMCVTSWRIFANHIILLQLFCHGENFMFKKLISNLFSPKPDYSHNSLLLSCKYVCIHGYLICHFKGDI